MQLHGTFNGGNPAGAWFMAEGGSHPGPSVDPPLESERERPESETDNESVESERERPE